MCVCVSLLFSTWAFLSASWPSPSPCSFEALASERKHTSNYNRIPPIKFTIKRLNDQFHSAHIVAGPRRLFQLQLLANILSLAELTVGLCSDSHTLRALLLKLNEKGGRARVCGILMDYTLWPLAKPPASICLITSQLSRHQSSIPPPLPPSTHKDAENFKRHHVCREHLNGHNCHSWQKHCSLTVIR